MKQLITFSLCLGLVAGFRTGGFIAGGVSDTELEEDYEPVQFAVQAINDMFTRQGDTQPRQLVEIVRARTQVVYAGWYEVDDPRGERLQVVAGPDCGPVEGPEPTQPMPMLGGEYPIDEVKDEVLVALMFAVREYNRRSNSNSIFKLGVSPNSLEVTGQIVAGLMYRFKNVPLQETECLKEDGPYFMLEPCQERDEGQEVTCNMKVWFQSWRTPQYTMEEMSCTTSQSAQRRHDQDEDENDQDEDRQ
ncbi:hypothetical protein BaRGS_00037324 [Batillaria attramentaria]|uniref:Cystatin domain-containing protein n=1 Tax=Batillaria attramentaria TaxID=370345 RepID=A0ABD0J935_9CAEN